MPRKCNKNLHILLPRHSSEKVEQGSPFLFHLSGIPHLILVLFPIDACGKRSAEEKSRRSSPRILQHPDSSQHKIVSSRSFSRSKVRRFFPLFFSTRQIYPDIDPLPMPAQIIAVINFHRKYVGFMENFDFYLRSNAFWSSDFFAVYRLGKSFVIPRRL